VDTKAVPVIVEEFGRLREEPACRQALEHSVGAGLIPARPKREGYHSALPSAGSPSPTNGEKATVADLYAAYARVVSGQDALESSALAPMADDVDLEGLRRYTTRYLPHELLRWGGDLEELFPLIWKALERRGITSEDFIRFWFRRPRPVTHQYDFLYVKLDRWVEFVGEVSPDLVERVKKEAEALRALHAELNDDTLRSPTTQFTEQRADCSPSR
jgi:hypothetical protein